MHSSIDFDPREAARSGARAQSPIYVLFLASVAAISGFLFGFDTAVINGVLLFLRRQFALTNLQTEWAASSLLVGCLFGAAGASLVGDRFGRRRSLLGAAILFSVATIGAALAPSITLFSVGRLLSGLAIGMASALTPVYIAEVAPAGNRGVLVSMNQLAIVVGILCSYLVSWYLAGIGAGSWRWMLGIAAIPSVIFFFGLLMIPESPRWLIANGRKAEGSAVLERIFGAKEAEAQLQTVEQAANAEEGSWHEVFAPAMRRPLEVGLMLAILCQITGINTVLYYGSIIVSENFHSAGTDTALAANVIIGGTNLVCTLIALFFLDRWGRRTMLLIASGGMTLSLGSLVLGVLSKHASPLLLLGSVVCYVGFFAFGMGPVVWIVIAEIFPNRVRGRAASIATSTLWTGTLLVTFTFLSLMKALTLAGAFALFAALSLFTFVYVWKRVPETRGKTLEQIQRSWGIGDIGDIG